MVRTQLLQLYRQRLLFWLVGVGMVIVMPAIGVLLIGLAGEDGEGYVGGIFGGLLLGLAGIGVLIIGMVVGATAGSRDYSSGVMRDYVLTGAARWKIHLSQYLAALIVTTGLMLAGAILTLLMSAIVFADEFGQVTDPVSLGEGDVTDLGRFLLASGISVAMLVLLSHSVGSFVRSRGIAIGLIAGYLLIVDNIVSAVFGPAASLWSAAINSTWWLLDGSYVSDGDAVGPLVGFLAWLALLVVAPLVRLYRTDL